MSEIKTHIIPMTFHRADVSEDGEIVILTGKDKAGNQASIGIDWSAVPEVIDLMRRATSKLMIRREQLGKDSFMDLSKSIKPFIVSGFQGGHVPDKNHRLLSLQTRDGGRFDFAIPLDMTDQRRRSLVQGIADELLSGGGADDTQH